MLVPKRVKHRREFRGKMRGKLKVVKKSHLENTAYKLLIHIGSLTAKSKLPVLQ